jgi:hypothetical protein
MRPDFAEPQGPLAPPADLAPTPPLSPRRAAAAAAHAAAPQQQQQRGARAPGSVSRRSAAAAAASDALFAEFLEREAAKSGQRLRFAQPARPRARA